MVFVLRPAADVMSDMFVHRWGISCLLAFVWISIDLSHGM